MKDRLRKDLSMLPKIYTFNLAPSLTQRKLSPFPRVTVHWRKRNSQISRVWLDTSSELTLTLEDPKCSLVRLVAYWVEFSSGPSHRGSSGPWTHPVLICTYFSCAIKHNWNRHTQQLAGFPYWLPDLWDEGCCGGKGQCKPLGLLLPSKIVNPKQYCIPGATAEIHAIIKDLKDAGVVIPPHPHSICLFGIYKRQMDFGEWQWLIINLTRW